MHRLKRLFIALLLAVLFFILLLGAGLTYLIISPVGGKILLRYFRQEFSAVGLLHVGHYEGSLHRGFVLKDVTVKGLSYLPDALMRIQEIHVRLPLWDISHYDISIFNARIFIPDSDPVVFTGKIYAGEIKGNLYSSSVDLHEASRFWINEDIKRKLQGFICNIDVNIEGPLLNPRVQGSFLADSIRYSSVILTSISSRVDLILFPKMPGFQMRGAVIMDSGNVKVRNVKLQLSPSNIIFQGDVSSPALNIRLGAKLEDMEFHLGIKGTPDNPQLLVSSDPPMAPQEALQVLFTGNALFTSTSPFNGVTSTQLAENFLNYSLQDDIDSQQQFGLKTKLTDNLKLGVEMDQLPSPPGETNIYYSRKINGEMDLNDYMSLNISQQVLPQNYYPSSSYQDAQSAAETEVYVQYKRRF